MLQCFGLTLVISVGHNIKLYDSQIVSHSLNNCQNIYMFQSCYIFSTLSLVYFFKFAIYLAGSLGFSDLSQPFFSRNTSSRNGYLNFRYPFCEEVCLEKKTFS